MLIIYSSAVDIFNHLLGLEVMFAPIKSILHTLLTQFPSFYVEMGRLWYWEIEKQGVESVIFVFLPNDNLS